MKHISLYTHLLFVFIFMLSFSGTSQTRKPAPNVIFVIIDDLGSGWIPPYAKNLSKSDLEEVIIEQYKKQQKSDKNFSAENHLEAAGNSMPFLDKLSKQGVKFNKCFTTSALCAPSRAGILTGKYAQNWGASTIPEIEKFGIPSNILLLPSRFQANGYKTALIGKWHVAPRDQALKNSNDKDHYQSSSAPGNHPLDKGFDYYYGYNTSNSTYLASKNLWENRNAVPAFTEKDFLTDVFNEKAKAFVQESVNEHKPFFLYYAPMTIHGGITPCPVKYSSKFNTGIPYTNNFAGHLLALDEGIAAIYSVLEKAGEVDNTLFILCSDNGGVAPVPPYNAPFKGGKGTGWLGGSHSPLIMVMPGKTRAMFNNDLVSCLDILPTALDVAGISVPKDLDGVSLKKLIFEGRQEKPHQVVFSTGLHSARWSYSYYEGMLKKNMDNEKCPVYAWGVNDSYFSLHLTEVNPGLYEKLLRGSGAQHFIFNYNKDPLSKLPLNYKNSEQKSLESKLKTWLQQQKAPLLDRKTEHDQLIKQIKNDAEI